MTSKNSLRPARKKVAKKTARRRTSTLTLTVQQASTAAIPVRTTLRRWMQEALQQDVVATLRFVGAREGRTLNHEFRGKDYATNVLTFPYVQSAQVCEGDIVLCMPVLLREAREQKKSWRAHCAHLVVHGMLHLQGYDHENDDDAHEMETLETAILARLGYADPYSDFSRQ